MSSIQSVLGPISPSQLGRTLTHEHISLDFECFHCNPPPEFQTFLNEKITLKTIGYVRQYPYSSHENLKFNDEYSNIAVKNDLELFKLLGGSSIVENSSHGLLRNLKFMSEMSKSTGVHIIAGTGHYVYNVQDESSLNLSIEQMYDLYTKEIVTGIEVDNIGLVKCGFIGEVGSNYPIHDFEKRSIRSTGEVQEMLGCGVSFHPGRDAKAPFEIMRIYLEAGGRADKCVMSHLDRTIYDVDQLLEFSKFGCYLQYDLFGNECSYYQLNTKIDMPSDGQRINMLVKLIEEGLVDKILMSHDVHTKHRLTDYGGHGYHHIFTNIVPRLLAKNISDAQIEQITVTNPASWLSLKI